TLIACRKNLSEKFEELKPYIKLEIAMLTAEESLGLIEPDLKKYKKKNRKAITDLPSYQKVNNNINELERAFEAARLQLQENVTTDQLSETFNLIVSY